MNEVNSAALKPTIRVKNTAIPARTPPTRYQKVFPSNPQVRPFESEAELVSVSRRSVFMVATCGWLERWRSRLKIADTDGGVGVDTEDFEEGEHDGRRRRDDCP